MKKIIMIVGGVIVLAGAVGGGIFVGKMQQPPAAGGAPTVSEEIVADATGAHGAPPANGEAPAHGEAAPAEANASASRKDLTFQFDEFITNLGDLKTFVKLVIKVEAFDTAGLKRLEDNVAPLRDATIMLLSGKSPEDMQGAQGKDRLKRELLTRYEGVLNSSKIVRNIYIDNPMVVQN